jgi:transcriptional regulator with XRE-family HTH domain
MNTSSRLVSGRQLRAARALAGLTQSQLSRDAGFNSRAAKYWEGNADKPPSSVVTTVNAIEAALARHGVIVFSQPTPGARLIDNSARKA